MNIMHNAAHQFMHASKSNQIHMNLINAIDPMNLMYNISSIHAKRVYMAKEFS